ncbi:hypothetical protein TELCIR_16752, partial [Teladorsagia circumcincta]
MFGKSADNGKPFLDNLHLHLAKNIIERFSGTAFEEISVYREHQGILEYSRAYNKLCEATDMFRRRYGADFPSLEEIAADSDVVFVSTDEFVDFPRPTLPHIVHIGGLGVGDSSKNGGLDEIFSEQMEKGSKGVVYFSLGTLVNTSSLPAFAMKAVVEAARRTPDYHFILVVDSNDK